MMLTRLQNRIVGTALILVGVVEMMGAAYVSRDFLERQEVAAKSYAVPGENCVARIRSLDVKEVSSRGNVVEFSVPGLEDPKMSLALSSVALVGCPGYDLVKFCLGYQERCEIPDGMFVRFMKRRS